MEPGPWENQNAPSPPSAPTTPRPYTMGPVAASASALPDLDHHHQRSLSTPTVAADPVPLQGIDAGVDANGPSPRVDIPAAAHDSMVTVRLSEPAPGLTIDTGIASAHPGLLRNMLAHNKTSFETIGEVDNELGARLAPTMSLESNVPDPDLEPTSAGTGPQEGSEGGGSAAEEEDEQPGDGAATPRPSLRTHSRQLSSNQDAEEVNWDNLQQREDEQIREQPGDNTALLLARLEQENAKLATNPKSARVKIAPTSPRKSRPPSMAQLRQMVHGPTPPALRYSMLPPPPMTDLEFYAALVKDYEQTAARLPTLLTHKIRKGIPPPLRGVVWTSMAGARDAALEEQYEHLSGQSSPFEGIIGKDLGRSFPGVDMFREADGEGQRMLGRVLKCFSVYDPEIGYCQGLAFIVGPLLMHMPDCQAFCVLVRLMENYDLRSCFLPDLSGLHVRIYQFTELLRTNLPTLSGHLDTLQVDPIYVSQWFLSFFAVTCPLPMLFRVYDVLFAEGVSETFFRVALSLMAKNQKRILACSELEDVMQLLLSRAFWDCYNYNADDLVQDLVSLSEAVTRERLAALEQAYHRDSTQSRALGANTSRQTSDVSSAASRFLGRLISSGSTSSSKTATAAPTPTSISSSSTITPATAAIATAPEIAPASASATATPNSAASSPSLAAPSRQTSMLRRSTSKQSLASTLNSMDANSSSAASVLSSASTEATSLSRDSHLAQQQPAGKGANTDDRYLNSQIEDLLTALSDLQRQQALLADQLQREREDREEDRRAVSLLLDGIKSNGAAPPIDETTGEPSQLAGLVGVVEERFTNQPDNRRSSVPETKSQLRDQLARAKEQLSNEVSKTQDNNRRVADLEQEISSLKEQLRSSQGHVRNMHQDKQRLEKQIHTMRARASAAESSGSAEGGDWFGRTNSGPPSAVNGLRELKLGRSRSTPSQVSNGGSPPNKRASSIFAMTAGRPAGSRESLLPPSTAPTSEHDALLLELVQAKTAEAIARQEADEAKQKLKSLRESLGLGPGDTVPPATTAASAAMGMFGRFTSSVAEAATAKPAAAPASTPVPAAAPTPTPAAAAPAASGVGGFFGWRRG